MTFNFNQSISIVGLILICAATVLGLHLAAFAIAMIVVAALVLAVIEDKLKSNKDKNLSAEQVAKLEAHISHLAVQISSIRGDMSNLQLSAGIKVMKGGR